MRQSDNYILSHLRRFFLQKCDTRLLLSLVSLVLCNSVYAQQITPNVSSGTKFEEAVHYENAEGVTRDYAKALALYCASAKNGNVNALYAMGWMYANGRGVIRDDQIAGLLFSLAAAKGHVHAGELLQYFPVNGTASTPVCLQPDPVEANEVDPSSGPATVFPTGRISKLVAKLAPLYQIDPQLAMAVISVESGFNVRAVSQKNAQGLMQLMPDTALRFRVKDPFDAEQNIKGGLAYLKWLLSHFKGDVALVAAAYNSGERTVEKYQGIPPFPETRDYVRRVIKIYNKAVHPYRSAGDASNRTIGEPFKAIETSSIVNKVPE